MTTAERPADTTADAVPTEEGAVDDATVDSPVGPEAATTPAADASADSAPDEAAPSTDGGDSKDAAEAPTKAKGPKPRAPKPGSPKPRAPKPGSGPSPAAIAAHATHPVKVPVVDEVTPEQLAAAEAFALANSAGIDITAAADLLTVSWGNSVMAARSAPITATRDFANSAAPVRNLDKDMGIIKDLARDEGLSLELALKSYEMFHHMIEQGNTEHDIAGVLEIIEERSKN